MIRNLFYKVRGYEQWLIFLEKEKLKLIKISCQCGDFQFRRVQLGEPCKHLEKIKGWLDWEIIEK